MSQLDIFLSTALPFWSYCGWQCKFWRNCWRSRSSFSWSKINFEREKHRICSGCTKVLHRLRVNIYFFWILTPDCCQTRLIIWLIWLNKIQRSDSRSKNIESRWFVQFSVRKFPTMRALLHRYTILKYIGLFKSHYKHMMSKEFDYNKWAKLNSLWAPHYGTVFCFSVG